MALVQVKRADLFPPGTSVEVYALPEKPVGELRKNNVGSPSTWSPALVKPESLVVPASGILEPTVAAFGLLLAAQVGGVWVYLEVEPTGVVT